MAPVEGTRPIPRRITHELLAPVPGLHEAVVVSTEPGIVAGTALLQPSGAGDWKVLRADGDRVRAGEPIVVVHGTAVELAAAEDQVLGVLGAAGGMARRAHHLRAGAPDGLHLACGAWKKLPASMKPALRAALDVTGLSHRLVEGAFVYVDKNVVRLLGGPRRAAVAGLALGHGPVAVQVSSVVDAIGAVAGGAAIVMVDDGSLTTLREVARAVGGDEEVRVAFGGGVGASNLRAAWDAGASIVDLGRAVLDAPLWDLRMEVVS